MEIADPPFFRVTFHLPASGENHPDRSTSTSLFTQVPTRSSLADLTQLASQYVAMFRPHHHLALHFPAWTPVGTGSLLHILVECDGNLRPGCTFALFDGRDLVGRNPCVSAGLLPSLCSLCEIAAVSRDLWPHLALVPTFRVNGEFQHTNADQHLHFPLIQPIPRAPRSRAALVPPFCPVRTTDILSRLPGFHSGLSEAASTTMTTVGIASDWACLPCTSTTTTPEAVEGIVTVAFAIPGDRPQAMRLPAGLPVTEVLWSLLSAHGRYFPAGSPLNVLSCPRVFPERQGGYLALCTLEPSDCLVRYVWVNIRTDVPVLRVIVLFMGTTRREIIQRFFPGRADLVLLLDGADAGDVPAIRNGCVLTICRRMYEGRSWPLSVLFEAHPSLRLFQHCFRVPTALRVLADMRQAGFNIENHLEGMHRDFAFFMAREMQEHLGKVCIEPHEAVVCIVSPQCGVCRATTGHAVAPNADQVADFVEWTWPEWIDPRVLDSEEFFEEAFYFFVTESYVRLTAWIRAETPYDDVLFLPLATRPELGVLGGLERSPVSIVSVSSDEHIPGPPLSCTGPNPLSIAPVSAQGLVSFEEDPLDSGVAFPLRGTLIPPAYSSCLLPG